MKAQPTNKQILDAITGLRGTVAVVDQKTNQILEAVGLYSNKVDARLGRLEHEMRSLNSSVKNYLELSDKRYLELRQTNRMMFKYLKLIAQKAKVAIDLDELEELIK